MSRNQFVRWVYEDSKPYEIDFSYKDARQFCKDNHWVDDWETNRKLGLEFAKRRIHKYCKDYTGCPKWRMITNDGGNKE